MQNIEKFIPNSNRKAPRLAMGVIKKAQTFNITAPQATSKNNDYDYIDYPYSIQEVVDLTYKSSILGQCIRAFANGIY